MISPLEAESKRTNRKLKLLIEVSTGYEVNLDAISGRIGNPGPYWDSWTGLGLLDRTGTPGLIPKMVLISFLANWTGYRKTFWSDFWSR